MYCWCLMYCTPLLFTVSGEKESERVKMASRWEINLILLMEPFSIQQLSFFFLILIMLWYYLMLPGCHCSCVLWWWFLYVYFCSFGFLFLLGCYQPMARVGVVLCMKFHWPWPEQTKCCGFSLTLVQRQISFLICRQFFFCLSCDSKLIAFFMILFNLN